MSALAALVIYTDHASADDWVSPTFSLQDFGTVGTVHSSIDEADFVDIFSQPTGAGYTDQWAWGVDTKLGVQVDAQFSDKLSGVVQVVSQHRYNNTYVPQVEWANLKYQFTPDFNVRVGRFVVATLMMSDARLVGYAYPWVRPPIDVYGQLPVTNKDGIDITDSQHFGKVKNSIQASYGRNTLKVNGGGTITSSRFFNFTDAVEIGPTTSRIAYDSHRFSFQFPVIDSLFTGLSQLGTTVSAIPGLKSTGAEALKLRDRCQLANAPFSHFSLWANYDSGNGLLMAEWAKAKDAAAFSSAIAWYATAAYHIEAFTPYVTLSKLHSETLSVSGISTIGLPPPLAQAATGLNAGLLNVTRAFKFSQDSVSVGVRWDFMKNTDLKLQYDHVKTDPTSVGRFSNVQPGFQNGTPFNLLSATVDFFLRGIYES